MGSSSLLGGLAGGQEHDFTGHYVLPSSSAQRRLWFVAQLQADGNASYNIGNAVRLRGPLRRVRLQQALDHVVARHESLRAGVALVEGEVRQVVAPNAYTPLSLVDRTGQDPASRDRALAELAGDHAARPFDLAKPPLLRAALVRFAEDDHVLLLTLHHLVADGWSLRVLLDELATAYRAAVRRAPVELPPLPVQYADYAAWHDQRTADGEFDASVAHLVRGLTGLAPLDLPTDLPRPPVRTSAGALRRARLDAATAAGVRELARRTGATPFMVLLAAFAALLGRTARVTDLAVGTPVANRPRADLEGVIGLFANTLVLRTDLSGDPAFAELVARVRDTCLDAFAHEEAPFERVVEELRLPRDLSRTPLYQVMFSHQDGGGLRRDFGDLTAEPLRLDTTTAKHDLTLAAVTDEGGVDLELEYSTDLFRPGTADRLLRQYARLLRVVTAEPATRLSEVDLLDDADRDLALRRWARGPEPTGPDEPLHRLVERQVDATPDRAAVVAADGELTYAALDARANRIAHHLRALGVGRGDAVAVCLDRTTDLPAALLGVLKAGAHYLPVDPAHPAERVRHVLADAAAAAVVTTSDLLARLPRTDRAPVLLDADPVADRPATRPDVQVGPDDLAYTIHTSGSTGRPKGVQVHHRAVANLLRAARDRVGFTAADVLGAVTSTSFDIAGLELFLPLTTGARVVIAPAAEVADGAALARWLADRGATVVQATPSTWRLLLAAGAFTALRPRLLLCGGEPLPPDLAAALVATGGELVNLYGPTEATIWSSADPVTAPDRIGLGRPLAGLAHYVLDERQRPVPPGAVGELHIGGVGVARGYLGRPALTAERFVPDPFSGAPGARLYRTGDLVRYDADGVLRFLGRTDDQVKVRGHRIEPGEVEAVLRGDDAVTDAAVVPHAYAEDDTRLVAHVVLAPGHDADAVLPRLRADLARQVPDYMVPAAFTALPELPRTPNGKLDRRALAEVRPRAATGGADSTPPRNRTERAVQQVFRDLLGVEEVGVRADFFDLGGHSLLAAKVMSRVREEFGVALPVREFFAAPTVAGLAEAIAEHRAATRAATRAPDADGDLRDVLARLSDDEVDTLLRRHAHHDTPTTQGSQR